MIGFRLQRALTIANIAAVGILIFFAGQSAYRQLTDTTFAPLYGPGYSTLQPADNSVRAGEVLKSKATKCSRGDNIAVTGTVFLQQLSPAPIAASLSLFSGGGVYSKGCIERAFATRIPPATIPGFYQLTGTEVAADQDGHTQRINWRSEVFEVTQ